MLNPQKIFFYTISLLVITIISCSSQEYTTAKLAIQQQDYVKAAEWLPKAMAIEPDNPEIPVVMAVEIYARDGQWGKMVELFDKAMNLNPEKTIEVRGTFLPLKEAVNNYTEHHWANEFNEGVEQFKNVENDINNKKIYLEKAIEHFQNAALIKPSDANTHSTLAKCYFDLGDNEAAKKSAIQAVTTNPESFDANFAAGQILSRTESSADEILPFYEKATQINPSNSRALRELASLHYDMGNKEKSIQVFENAIANEENKIVKADLFFNLGVIHSQMQNYEDSEKAFEEAHFLNEDDFEAALGIASSYEGLGDKYLNGADGFEKDFNEASRWYRKAEKKIKSVMMVDIDNTQKYKKQLELLRYKRDVADGEN